MWCSAIQPFATCEIMKTNLFFISVFYLYFRRLIIIINNNQNLKKYIHFIQFFLFFDHQQNIKLLLPFLPDGQHIPIKFSFHRISLNIFLIYRLHFQIYGDPFHFRIYSNSNPINFISEMYLFAFVFFVGGEEFKE